TKVQAACKQLEAVKDKVVLGLMNSYKMERDVENLKWRMIYHSRPASDWEFFGDPANGKRQLVDMPFTED
ncbi:UNVERIFIED_CONTAM: hypothetical protein K2H54_048542, partial [Gekko kuhli]